MNLRRTASVLGAVLAIGISALGTWAPPAQAATPAVTAADTPQPTPGVFYEIFNAFSPFAPACVDVPGGSTRPGANLIAFRCHSGSNQLWQFIRQPSGFYEIANQHSQQCFELPNSSGADGTPVEQAGCFDFTSEEWEARFVFFKTIPVYQFVNQAFPWLCLALGNGGSAVNGTPIVISLCDSGNPAELWSLG